MADSGSNLTVNPVARIMTDLARQTWACIDGAVAWLFGLDQSKYQWAVERHHQQQAEELELRRHDLEGAAAASCDGDRL